MQLTLEHILILNWAEFLNKIFTFFKLFRFWKFKFRIYLPLILNNAYQLADERYNNDLSLDFGTLSLVAHQGNSSAKICKLIKHDLLVNEKNFELKTTFLDFEHWHNKCTHANSLCLTVDNRKQVHTITFDSSLTGDNNNNNYFRI